MQALLFYGICRDTTRRKLNRICGQQLRVKYVNLERNTWMHFVLFTLLSWLFTSMYSFSKLTAVYSEQGKEQITAVYSGEGKRQLSNFSPGYLCYALSLSLNPLILYFL